MRRTIVAWLAALAGCGPSLTHLVAEHHDREAICAAVEGGADDRDLVSAALDADSEPRIHVTLVPLDADFAIAQFARVEVQPNIVPVDHLSAFVAVAHARPLTWETLVALTGEPLPPKRVVDTYVTGGNFLRGVAALLTFGISLSVTSFDHARAEVDAEDWDYARTAPRAHRLHDALPLAGCRELANASEGAGARCSWFYVLDGQPERVEVTLTYAADRKTRLGRDGDHACAMTRTTAMSFDGLGGAAMHRVEPR